LGPAHVTQHHFSGEAQRTWVHLVLASVLRCSTGGGFEHGNGVRQVGTWSDADTAYFGRQGVGQVVTVEVQGRDHIVFGRTQQNLLQHGVGDSVFDDDVFTSARVLELHPRTA